MNGYGLPISTFKRLLTLMIGGSLFLASCASEQGLTTSTIAAPIETVPESTTTAPSTTTTTMPRDCSPVITALPDIVDEVDPAVVSVLVSEATFPCSNEVTVARAGATSDAGEAALHASTTGGPLLLVGRTSDVLAAEIARLGPSLISLGAGVDPTDPAFAGIATRVLPSTLAIRGTIAQGTEPSRLLVVGDNASTAWPAIWAAARSAGDTAVFVGSADVRALEGANMAALRSAPGAATTLFGPFDDDASWQLASVRSGTELPGGGFLMFPYRRLVAFYGHPQTHLLGVLGEQGLEGAQATIDRMAPIVESYAADGVPTVPAFEIIATVAAAEATSDGDYSRETPLDIIRPWVETAGEQGVYVILDLQPGRTDFLTQAKIYEEFLRLPHVGLAIDPEWRLKPNQVHLRQIGSVDAQEINDVADWLATIVREDSLPQKLLLLHQFRIGMIPNREIVELHPELAIAVQMDGQGGLQNKYGTWGVLTTQPDSGRLWWGWKNFYDEDFPMATPDEVFDLEPTAYLVSFQ